MTDSLMAALKEIRDKDEHEIALDPDWPRRIAAAALSSSSPAVTSQSVGLVNMHTRLRYVVLNNAGQTLADALMDGLETDSGDDFAGTLYQACDRLALAALAEPASPPPTRITKEWCLNMAALEDGEIGAGMPNHPLRIPAVEGVAVTEDQIKHMAERFLGWQLPDDFLPDNGITFDPISNRGSIFETRRVPVGTNLLNYEQALAMVRYLVEGLATQSVSTKPYSDQGKTRNANVAVKAKADRRWKSVSHCIESRMSIAEAAKFTGISRTSIRAILYRRTGSSLWPVTPETGA